jgi:hypothetical protein
MGTLSKQGGYALAVVIILALISAVMVAAFLSMTLTEFRIVYSNNDSIASFHIAEAGLEKGARLLYDDLMNTPAGTAPSWGDLRFYFGPGEGDYTSEASVTYFPAFRQLLGETVFGGGTYRVELANVAGSNDTAWLRSTGTYRGKTRAVLSMFRMKNINPWNNAIFAGAGQAGRVINGNVDIRGSVHILGEEDYHGPVMEMSGGAFIGNHYQGMPWELSSRVPSITRMVNGGPLDTLDAEVRVRYGQISLSGSADIGAPVTVGEVKNPVDGTYVTDGFTGNKGTSNVYSDNGTDTPYDVPAGYIDDFPKITDPYGGYSSYMNYLRANALVISNPSDLSKLSNITKSSTFSFSNAKGSIAMDGNGNLTISGVVVIEGNLVFAVGTGGNKGAIAYNGSAAILAAGNITIENTVLVRSGETFPTTAFMGLMTPNTITFQTSQLSVQGIFYAQQRITSTKQTSVTGTFFSDYFDMGTNVPSIYQVPSVVDNLPFGIFGSKNLYTIRRDCFREVDAGSTQ